jgi:EAL domain-containing protein (putative c-di-GMP-specific phosphodiesterase class I)/GGDEF domain-containing protein
MSIVWSKQEARRIVARQRPADSAASGDLAAFLAASARWLGASRVRLVDALHDPGPHPDDPVASQGLQWLSAGAPESEATAVIDRDERLEFAAVGRDGALAAVLIVQRPLRRPRPAVQSERVAAVAALAGYLLENGSTSREDTESAGRAVLASAADKAEVPAIFAVGTDRLAVVNEVFGRPAGDAILQATADRLSEWAGPHGVVVRLSGTRFGVTRADLGDLDTAMRAAYDLRDRLAVPVPVDGLPISRSVSIGVAVGGAGGSDAARLVTEAVRSSLAAREAGGDAVRSYDPRLAEERLGRLQLELELDNALHTGQLRLFYQPEFDLRTGQLLAVEALLRWDHPQLGLIRADMFVDDTERTRTFGGVQAWVLDEACRQLAGWQALPGARGLGLRINVSAWQIARGEIADMLLAIVRNYGLAADSVCVELTERRMPRRTETIAEALDLLSKQGISIAIDDFGTGQGTVSQLTTLPVDTIKIDQSFVTAMRTDPRADAVVAGVIALAASLSLEIVAEGVDGADTAARLVRLGCTRGQGNSLGEAMPAQDLERLLRH